MLNAVVTLGEVMLRLSTPGHQRFEQANELTVSFAGAEANVASSLANFGVHAHFVTRLPDNELGRLCARSLRWQGVGVDHLVWGGERIGLLFLEAGAAQRGSKVIYDREHSSFASMKPEMVDWRAVFAGADWFHFTGITPALGAEAAEVCLRAARAAKDAGAVVSCDLNYRSKLWQWSNAEDVMSELVGHADLIIGNEEDAQSVFHVSAPDVDVEKGQVEASKYVSVCEQLVERFPNLRGVAITLRGSLSASHNTWSAVFWHEGKMHVAPTYDILPIVDRVGGGDSFAAGLIYGFGHARMGPQRSVEFAVAASCLKHTVNGDVNLVSVEEVERLAAGNASGRVVR